MNFTFNRGVWEDKHSLPEWVDGEGYEEYLSRVGFSTIPGDFGHRDGGQIQIYESSSHNGTFYASVAPFGGSVFDVYLPDFPSMMMFIKDYATPFSVESVNAVQGEILAIMEKQFRLQHGHSAHSICHQCDPEGWEAACQAREARQRKQA